MAACLGLGALLAPGCEDDPCVIENCQGSGKFLLRARNEGNQDMKLLVDGADSATLAPGEEHCQDLSVQVQHLVEFRWTDGATACNPALANVVECNEKTLTCGASR
jgi:hypothetical protein